MEKLPIAIYYVRLPRQYENHVTHIAPFKAEVQVKGTIRTDILRDIGQENWFDLVVGENKPILEARVQELCQAYDADLALMERPEARKTSERFYKSEEEIYPIKTSYKIKLLILRKLGIKPNKVELEADFTITANGSAFKTTGINMESLFER